MNRHLITTIRQSDGGTRYLYASTASDARSAVETIRQDRAMIDHLGALVSEIIDEDASGNRERVK